MHARLFFASGLCLIATGALAQQNPPAPAPPSTSEKPRLAADPGPFLEPNPPARVPRARPVAGPAPHLPDGRPDFGGNGAWYPGFAGNIAEATWKGVKSADKKVDVPFLPWALEVFNQRVETNSKDDPEARCLPVGVPRYMFDP